jgi:hypothetical protein
LVPIFYQSFHKYQSITTKKSHPREDGLAVGKGPALC